MFADTDFILALIKESDWLKENALEILKKHKGKIKTSVSVMVELALLCKRLKMDTLETFANTLEIIKLNDADYAICMKAALYTDKHGLNVFDSFHAAFCGDDQIISSDSAYEKIGIKMVNLR